MKKLDWYILRKFLGTFFFVVVLFSMIAVVIDLTEKIDDFLKKDVPFFDIVFGYYVNFLPYIDSLLAPLFIFISVIYFTSKLAGRSEIIAMVGNGINYYRILVPYIVGALILGSTLFVFNHYLVPKSNHKRLEFEAKFILSRFGFQFLNMHMQVAPNNYLFLKNYSQLDTIGYNFSYEVIKEGKLLYKMTADRIKWNGQKNVWEMRNYFVRQFDRRGEHILKGPQLDTLLTFLPKDLSARTSIREEMTTPELRKYIKQLEQRGVDYIDYYYIEEYRRTANAYTVLVLTIIGYVIASRKVRGGTGLKLVAGISLALAYIIFERFATTFATNGNLDPFIATWIPNMIFTVICLTMLFKAQK